jgi:hypothetical protein
MEEKYYVVDGIRYSEKEYQMVFGEKERSDLEKERT